MSLVKNNLKDYTKSARTEAQERFLSSHNHCCLCGNTLTISTAILEGYGVHEKVCCQECRVTISTRNHILN